MNAPIHSSFAAFGGQLKARKILDSVVIALKRQAAVAIIGPRQVGKTTLALEIAQGCPSVCLDREAFGRSPQTR